MMNWDVWPSTNLELNWLTLLRKKDQNQNLFSKHQQVNFETITNTNLIIWIQNGGTVLGLFSRVQILAAAGSKYRNDFRDMTKMRVRGKG